MMVHPYNEMTTGNILWMCVYSPDFWLQMMSIAIAIPAIVWCLQTIIFEWSKLRGKPMKDNEKP
jgi:hypothetical protein